MRQTASIISTYTADVSGVCSALFELGGMTVMHDASGCNSTYNTHDEPRWYDTDSLVFLSGLSELEAVMGDDEKFIGDVAEAARELHPAFIALAGTPIPMVIGTDFAALASLIEQRTGIPTFGFATNGMHSYLSGASQAFAALAERLVQEPRERRKELSVNLLGVTPLDFSVGTMVGSLRRRLEAEGIAVASCWAMGDSLENICWAGQATVNLVVSWCGLAAARVLRRRFGTPYVVGTPVGEAFTHVLAEEIRAAARDGQDRLPLTKRPPAEPGDLTLIAESVTGGSLAAAMALEQGKRVRLVCPLETEDGFLLPGDVRARDEVELEPLFKEAGGIIADPLYRPLYPPEVPFYELPHEAFSGRIYRRDIPDFVDHIPFFEEKRKRS